MKLLLAILLLLAFCSAETISTPETDIVGDPVDFLRGLLDGLGVKEDIEKLKKCLKDVEKLIDELKIALQYLKKMDPADLKKGLELMFSALMEFLANMKACADSGSVIYKLIHLITNANILSIVTHILMHPVAFVADIEQAIAGFARGDLYTAGKSIGDMLRIIFL